MNIKQSLEEWKEHLKQLTSLATIITDEPEMARRGRIANLEADPEAWFNYYFPQYSFAPAAAFHRESTARVVGNREWFEVRIWSRELAKSTRTMMEVLYLLLVGHNAGNEKKTTKKYVLLISNSLDNAARLLLPYKINLEQNQRIIQDYGQQESTGKWQAAEFTTAGGASFRALGAGQSPRGARNEETRPDILLFDDIDTDADCLNPELVAKKWRWIEEAAIGTRSVSQPTTVIFCGNLISRDSCMELSRSYADHVSLVNIRDGNGKSTWPEKNSETDIDRVLSQKSYTATQKEYFNNPVSEGSVFGQMAWKPALPMAAYNGLVCYTDPSFTVNGDYKATVLAGRAGTEYHIIKAYVEQTATRNMAGWLSDINSMLMGCRCYFYMEQVFLQEIIISELHQIMGTANPVILRPDKRAKPNKFTRIESMLEPLHRAGRLFLNENERHNPHMKRLEQQFTAFAFGGNAHDDGPDAVEGAIWKLKEMEGMQHLKPVEACGPHRRTSKY